MVDLQKKRDNFINKFFQEILRIAERDQIPIADFGFSPEWELLKTEILNVYKKEKDKDMRIAYFQIVSEPEFERDGTEISRLKLVANFINEPDSTDPGEVGEQTNTT